MEPFQVVHRFRTLANRGYITPLVCRVCSHDLTITVGEDDEPSAKCYTCGARANISAATLNMMHSVITNYETGRVH